MELLFSISSVEGVPSGLSFHCNTPKDVEALFRLRVWRYIRVVHVVVGFSPQLWLRRKHLF